MARSLTAGKMRARVSKVDKYVQANGCIIGEALKKVKIEPSMYYSAKKKLAAGGSAMKVHKVEIPAHIPEIRDLNVMIQGDKVIVTLSKAQAAELFSKLF